MSNKVNTTANESHSTRDPASQETIREENFQIFDENRFYIGNHWNHPGPIRLESQDPELPIHVGGYGYHFRNNTVDIINHTIFTRRNKPFYRTWDELFEEAIHEEEELYLLEVTQKLASTRDIGSLESILRSTRKGMFRSPSGNIDFMDRMLSRHITLASDVTLDNVIDKLLRSLGYVVVKRSVVRVHIRGNQIPLPNVHFIRCKVERNFSLSKDSGYIVLGALDPMLHPDAWKAIQYGVTRSKNTVLCGDIEEKELLTFSPITSLRERLNLIFSTT